MTVPKKPIIGAAPEIVPIIARLFSNLDNSNLPTLLIDVEISSKNISHLSSKSKDVEYWVALEPESSYE